LLLESIELRGHRHDDIVDAQQVVLGGVELQLGLMAALVEAGGASGLIEQLAAVARLRGDQRTNPSLANDAARMRAGGGVGEQELHVARPRLAAIDPIGRARAAIDPPHDLDRIAVVKGDRRVARRIVDRQRHLGDVAGRAVRRAGENHVVHLAAAQPPRRRLTHYPAERLDQVRLTAAVGTDDSGQPGFDRQLGRVDKRLEPGETEPLYLHASITGPRRGRSRRSSHPLRARCRT
jgi:hypothetical protein